MFTLKVLMGIRCPVGILPSGLLMKSWNGCGSKDLIKTFAKSFQVRSLRSRNVRISLTGHYRTRDRWRRPPGARCERTQERDWHLSFRQTCAHHERNHRAQTTTVHLVLRPPNGTSNDTSFSIELALLLSLTYRVHPEFHAAIIQRQPTCVRLWFADQPTAIGGRRTESDNGRAREPRERPAYGRLAEQSWVLYVSLESVRPWLWHSRYAQTLNWPRAGIASELTCLLGQVSGKFTLSILLY